MAKTNPKYSKNTQPGSQRILPRPVYRKLTGYAFDPSLSLVLDTFEINNIVYKIDWEEPLAPGPAGEYIEVVDYDPSLKMFYAPVDLNDPYILASDGLMPSEGNPQFHQQMVYAVAMTTIKNFEKALGRKVLWAPRRVATAEFEEYVPQLRIYPHALREANAYYSPLKKSILFGYFPATPADKAQVMPGSLVFTCLSHDIIAHEVTHAILDGLHRNYNHASNPDVLAFHEAFSDLVALFQHFSFPEVLKHQIAKTKGNLEKQNLLGELAKQFGSAIGKYGSLRDALGENDPWTGEWKPAVPNPQDYQQEMEPHRRGSILVAAVFEAFLVIYKRRVADLLRIATGGTGVLPEGDLHPDLVNRLANEAAKSAKHVLTMCIRAIDYCPPVDITFGDFLRALITADQDIVYEDSNYYRLAFIDAFRRRGIYPEGINSLNEESLRYRIDPQLKAETADLFSIIAAFLRAYREEVIYETDREQIFNKSKRFITGGNLNLDNEYILSARGLHNSLASKFDNSYAFEKMTGLIFNKDWKSFGIRGKDRLSYQILNLRLVSRVSPDGDQINQIVFNLVQTMEVIYENDRYKGPYLPEAGQEPPPGRFEVHGGCTLIFDLDTVDLKYAISKPLLRPELLEKNKRMINEAWIDKQYRYQANQLDAHISELAAYFNMGFNRSITEPFALLHHP